MTLDQIPARGFDAQVQTAWAAAPAAAALEGEISGLTGTLHLTRIADSVRVQGDLQVDVVRACDRCGARVRLHLGGPLDLLYAPSGQLVADLALDAEDLDVGWLDEPAIELARVVSEQLALWLPIRVVCDSPHATRLDGDGPCAVPPHASGPELHRRSPFAGLTLPE